MHDLISVIIPIYNCERYLERCLSSVLNQSYDNYEVILIDDGSEDGSGLICDRYADAYEKIKVIHQNNKGVSVARNQGVKNSSGKYISFVDADDWIPSNGLSVLASVAEFSDADMVVAGLKWYIDGEDVQLSSDDCKMDVRYYNNREAIQVLGAEGDSKFKSASGKIIKRSLVEKDLFPKGRKVGEDTTCVYKWLYSSSKVAVLNIPLYFYYRSNPDSATANSKRYLPGVFETFDEMMSFFTVEEFPELIEIWRPRYTWAMASKCAHEKEVDRTSYRQLRKKLRSYLKQNHMPIEQYPYEFEVAYPSESQFYWLLKGIKHKLTGKA